MPGKWTETVMGAKAREYIMAGVNAIYLPVRKTLGPQGSTALIYRSYNRGTRITDDGVTVAENQDPKNAYARLVAMTFKEMAKRTVEKVGDGTTTTIVIGGKLMTDLYAKLVEGSTEMTAKRSGVSAPATMRREILASAEKVKAAIGERKQKVETLEQLERIGAISVKDEALGKTIAKMAWETGIDGFIDVVEGYKGEIETEIIKGMRFPAKVASKAFVNNPKRFEMIATNADVLVTNIPMDNGSVVGPLFSRLNEKTSKVVVIAPSFSENVLVAMVNAVKQGFYIFPVAAASLRTEQFEDVAVYCGAEFVDKQKGRKLESITPLDLGTIEKMVVKDTNDREETVAIGGGGTQETQFSRMDEVEKEVEKDIKKDGKKTTEKVKVKVKERVFYTSTKLAEHIEVLKGQLNEQKIESHKLLMQRRIASMASAVGVVRVGDTTQASSSYLKLKIEDAVYACKAALRGGWVKGGGLELKAIAEELLSEEDPLRAALCEPYRLIQASVEGGLEITDDIIDPAEAIYFAVEHATGVVANLITVESITVEGEEVGPGDGYMAIARNLGELSITMKRHFGLLQESQELAERDRMEGLTVQEKLMLDQG